MKNISPVPVTFKWQQLTGTSSGTVIQKAVSSYAMNKAQEAFMEANMDVDSSTHTHGFILRSDMFRTRCMVFSCFLIKLTSI